MTTTIALITGANKGIGLATARRLGALGWTVLVGARDAGRGREATEKLRGDGVDARLVPLDVTDEASVAAAAELVEREYGRLDVLVNNAGILRVDGGALPSETTLATLREVYETNVFGVVTVTNALLPLLRRAPAARIVNVSSEVGSITAMTDPDGPYFALTSVPYPSSKTALNMVTAMYAKELRDTPIKVNAANPGYCATDLNGHSGFLTPEQGAQVSVHLATLPADGPSGQLWGHLADADGGYGVLPW
ncbi:SDR family oxidoreductase [Micromonospora auratinigra]|uniref:NAD(P)-dependent dehydrogenase, short-chain alcohol dehydrogenase family n=1 Tax=Micromonospora auratinigra TaxID=261654 RepID=A0A1A9A8H8_9ACTN|nr:SDR family oxidoreductase [Micromonospora auratinigra]SBT52518.1 NAD(P)-dependent dehydrogenase, short-chain alcohol dehydrogenase family [Micromonospora auratinigra]